MEPTDYHCYLVWAPNKKTPGKVGKGLSERLYFTLLPAVIRDVAKNKPIMQKEKRKYTCADF